MRRFPPYPKKTHPSGQARISIGGKHVYLGKFDSPESWNEYRRRLAEWQAAPSSVVTRRGGLTVNDIIARHWIHAEQHYGKSPELEHFRQVGQVLGRLYGDTHASDFGPLALKAVRQAMIDGSWLTDVERKRRTANHNRWSRKLVNARINKLRRMFKWAASEELIPSSIYESLRTVAGLQRGRSAAPETDRVRPVADSLVEDTLPHLPRIIRAMVELQRLTGMRPGEVCAMRPRDITKSFVINGASLWLYRPDEHKTAHHEHTRTIVIGPKGQAVLAPFLVRDDDAYCFCPRETVNRRRGLRPAGDCYTTCSYGRRIRIVCDRHRLERWAPNQLRHAAGTQIGHLFDLETAKSVLGHRDPKITMVYVEEDVKRAALAAMQVG